MKVSALTQETFIFGHILATFEGEAPMYAITTYEDSWGAEKADIAVLCDVTDGFATYKSECIRKGGIAPNIRKSSAFNIVGFYTELEEAVAEWEQREEAYWRSRCIDEDGELDPEYAYLYERDMTHAETVELFKQKFAVIG